jgi:hypothetical protein
MAQVLDKIIVKDLVGSRGNTAGSINYESINSSGNAEKSADTSKSEDNILISMSYANGVANNITFVVQGSADNLVFSDITDTQVAVTDSSGTITWDLVGVRPNYTRIKWTVSAGSLDIQATLFAGRRH